MKGILKYENKTKEISFKDIPTLYAVMEDKHTYDEKKELIISKKDNIILSKDKVFNPKYQEQTYLRKSIFQDYRLCKFNGYDVIQK